MKIEIEFPDQVHREDPCFSRYFEALQMMANRMAVSHFKYGPVGDAYPDHVDSLKSADERRKKYLKDGNTEWCLDAANQYVIEHLFPSHKKAHFKATDSKDSPGLQYHE